MVQDVNTGGLVDQSMFFSFYRGGASSIYLKMITVNISLHRLK